MLTVPDAARLARRNPETIRRWIREGRLAAHKVGTQHVIEAEALELALGRTPARRTAEAVAPYAGSAQRRAEPGSSTNRWLPAIVGRIVRAVDPVRIVLAGPSAVGQGADDDDCVLLVVLDSVSDRLDNRVTIRRSFADLPVAAEIVVASVAEAEERSFAPVAWALDEGRNVYDRVAPS